MKKVCALLIIISLLTLWGCQSGDLVNATIFSDRFNNYSKSYTIDTKKMTSQLIDGQIKYSYILSSNDNDGMFLLTLFALPDNLNISSCSLTFLNGNIGSKSKNISIENLELLNQTAASVIQAYTKESSKQAEVLLKELGLDNTKKYAAENSKYKDEQWYRFSLISNDAGVTFKIESVHLCTTTESDLTLRN